MGKNDNLLVFYAGHGYWDELYREGYWLPSDAEQANRANWVSNSDIQRAFRAIQSRHILLLSDACFAGSLLATRYPFLSGQMDSQDAIKALYSLPSRRAITAGNFTEVPDQSAYKFYLGKYLQQNNQKYLDAGSLFAGIKLPIINNSKATPQYGVIQETGDEGGEFIFVRRE